MFDLNYHEPNGKIQSLDAPSFFVFFWGAGVEIIIPNEFCMSEGTREQLSFPVQAQPTPSK